MQLILAPLIFFGWSHPSPPPPPEGAFQCLAHAPASQCHPAPTDCASSSLPRQPPQVSPDGALVGLDTQPLFSLSVLGELARLERPSLPLATPAVAAASVTKSSAVPYEAAQRLMELQQGVLLLSVCHLVGRPGSEAWFWG